MAHEVSFELPDESEARFLELALYLSVRIENDMLKAKRRQLQNKIAKRGELSPQIQEQIEKALNEYRPRIHREAVMQAQQLARAELMAQQQQRSHIRKRPANLKKPKQKPRK